MADELMRNAGAKMANTMFNLAQRAGDVIDSDLAASFDQMRKEWDAAVRAAPSSPVADDGLPLLPEPVRFAQWTGGEELAYTPAQVRQVQREAYEAGRTAGAPEAIFDEKRLMFAMQDIDGFVSVEWDKYDYAIHFAEQNERDEPAQWDELMGVRMMIDAAMVAVTAKLPKEDT